MNHEIAQALRQLADRIEQGAAMPKGEPVKSAVVFLTDDAHAVSASYIGRLMPPRQAGAFIAASGIQRFLQSDGPAQSATQGSTH